MVKKLRTYLTLLGAVLLCAGAQLAGPASAKAAGTQDLMLGVFWNSDKDLSDTLYASANGLEFQRIGTPIKTAGNGSDVAVGLPVNYVHAIHDPGLFYKDGYFWMIGGFVQDQRSSGRGYRFMPMFSASKDLVHWSYPNSTKVEGTLPSPFPSGTTADKSFDTAGTEAFADDDGSVWVVTSLGHFGPHHGESSSVDNMTPYIMKVSGLEPAADPAVDPAILPKGEYGTLSPINLPISDKNWIDPAIYKENGTYYLSIKRNGVTNMIFSIKDLNRAGDPNAWTLVCGNVVTGYEGPSLTNLNGTYLMYTDKLADFPYMASDGTTGTFVTRSSSLNSGWHGTQRIYTLGLDSNGKKYTIPNRHGSVLRVPAEARQTVLNAIKKAGWDEPQAADATAFWDVNYADWYADAVKFSNRNGLIKGYSGGDPTFGVGQPLTRAQLAAILWRVADPDAANAYTGTAANETGMPDVAANQWYTGAANWAVKHGVINGSDGRFAPNDPVTLEQMIAIIANYTAKDEAANADQSVLNAFRDQSSISGWARSSVAWGKTVGLVNGYANGNLGPRERVNRERAAAILYNAFEKGILD